MGKGCVGLLDLASTDLDLALEFGLSCGVHAVGLRARAVRGRCHPAFQAAKPELATCTFARLVHIVHVAHTAAMLFGLGSGSKLPPQARLTAFLSQPFGKTECAEERLRQRTNGGKSLIAAVFLALAT
ncbi:hypothetical protein AWB78_07350 [Caballeronia calidae]|uniref:Uncharacterized protein n=1 Tax=Caballeronia calidae TaxID=1777139 RepID=A0A158EEF1_9BURK|nr:hypothetical protein AWB78_07350 [Caballeronia calidae]